MFKNNVWKMVVVLFVISLLIGMAVPSYAANAGRTVKGIVRTASGVFDTVTFPIPPYEKTWLNPEFIGQPTK